MIAELITLGATEAAPSIAAAFATDRVDETVSGDLEDVEIALGLRVQRDTPARNYFLEAYGPLGEEPFVDADLPGDAPEPLDRLADLPPLPAPGSSVKRVTVERKAKSKRKMGSNRVSRTARRNERCCQCQNQRVGSGTIAQPPRARSKCATSVWPDSRRRVKARS